MDDMMTTTFVRLGGFAAQPVLELKISTIIDDSFSFSSSSGVVVATRTTLPPPLLRALGTLSLLDSLLGSQMSSIMIIMTV